jgi:hypothetical protein
MKGGRVDQDFAVAARHCGFDSGSVEDRKHIGLAVAVTLRTQGGILKIWEHPSVDRGAAAFYNFS